MSMDPFAGWPRWRFINYWKPIVDKVRIFLAVRWRVSNFWKRGIVEDFWSFCLFNFYVSGKFIGVTILNFSLEYKRQHPAKTDPALPVQPGIWRVAYTPAKGSTCNLEHRCAVCGAPALDPGHGTRGDTWKREGLANCPDYFLVRCLACKHLERKLEGQILAVELTVGNAEEFRKRRLPIVYDLLRDFYDDSAL